jgi:uncharacterized protein
VPRIGLLSDSHGRVATTKQAVSVLLEQRIDTLIHLGDLGSMEVIDELVVGETQLQNSATSANNVDAVATAVQSRLVFGNVDWDRASMAQYARHLGIGVADPAGKLDLPDGRQLIFTHGHDDKAVDDALASGASYLCHGHSHRVRDEKVDSTRVLNPGALFRAKQYTVAVLDTDTDNFTVIELD